MTELEHCQQLTTKEYLIQNYKADGAIGGGIAFAVVGDHENRPTDMTNILVLDVSKHYKMRCAEV